MNRNLIKGIPFFQREISRAILSPAPVPGINTGLFKLHPVMNRQAHLTIGVLLFFIYGYVISFFHVTSFEFLVVGVVADAAGSIFPDLIEPPVSAKHRRICHSRRTLKWVSAIFILTAIMVISAPGIPHFPLVFCSSCFSLGYAAHLLADSLTKAGLPR